MKIDWLPSPIFFFGSPRSLAPYPFGQAAFWCPRDNPYGPNWKDSDHKIGQPAGDALRERGLYSYVFKQFI
jgi:hypothetical protein